MSSRFDFVVNKAAEQGIAFQCVLKAKFSDVCLKWNLVDTETNEIVAYMEKFQGDWVGHCGATTYRGRVGRVAGWCLVQATHT